MSSSRPTPRPHATPRPGEMGAPCGRQLLTGPAGSGKTTAALLRIKEAATAPGDRGRGAAAPGAALLVLPTYAQVMHVKRLALSRWQTRGILDEPFTTFTAAGERFLPGFHVRALPSAEERDRLMEEALRTCDVPLFREIADRPGFRAKLLRLVKELKQTGLEGEISRGRLRAAEVAGDGLSEVARLRMAGFLSVFEAYEALLERAGLEDHEDALRRLADALATGGDAESFGSVGAPPRVLVVDGFDDFTTVEEQILFRLVDRVVAHGGQALVTLPGASSRDAGRELLFQNSAGIRARLLKQDFVEERLTGFPRASDPALASLAGLLFGRAPTEPLPATDAVQSLLAGDSQDEAETVARTLRSVLAVEGVRGWRDIGVVVRQLTEFAPRLEAACARLGVPLRVVGGGSALAREAVLRALRGPLHVVAGRTEAGAFQPGLLMEWLRWLALTGPDALAVSDVDAWDMEQRKDGLPADFETFCDRAPEPLQGALGALSAAATELASLARPSELYAGLARVLEALAPLPAPSGFHADGRPRDALHDERLAHAAAALGRMQGILSGLGAAVERTDLGGALGVSDAVRELEEAADRTMVRLPDRRLDAVTLMDFEEARFWELPVVFVCELEEGSVPLRPRQDLILRDADRRALRSENARTDGRALRLPLASEKEVRERRLFYGAVTRASRRLYLSRRAYDEKGNPRGPSSYLLELERIVTPTVRVEARTPGRVAHDLAECYTAGDLRLFAAGRLAPWSARRADVPEEERVLARALQEVTGTQAPARVRALRRREPGPLWADDARRQEVLALFHDATRTVSVSRLNQAIHCPQRFFLAYVASIPRDELTLAGPAFNFMTKGSALHHAFDVALKDPSKTAAEAACEGVSHVHATGLDARLLTVELERAVELLRVREADTHGLLAPWREGLELDFSKERAVPLGPKDCRYRLGGYIDRIDRTPAGDVSIVDYKRSPTSVNISYKKCLDDADLQLPLYARAVESMGGALEGVRVVGLEWVAGLRRSRRIIHDADASALFAGRREANAPYEDTHAEFRARLTSAEDTATNAVRAARAGDYARRPKDAGGCDECSWLRICRPDVAWLESQAEARLEAMRLEGQSPDTAVGGVQ